MENIKRWLTIDLPEGQSVFLWGPRKTGKSTWLKQTFPSARGMIDLRSKISTAKFAKTRVLPKVIYEKGFVEREEKCGAVVTGVPPVARLGRCRRDGGYYRRWSAWGSAKL